MKKSLSHLSVLFIAFFLLAACDDSENKSANSYAQLESLGASAGAAGGSAPSETSNVKLAYTHFLGFEMPPSNVETRYEKARNACLHDTALNCSLVNASFNKGNPLDAIMPSASLSVRLPHDQVAVFEQSLMAELPGENASNTFLATQSTSAEDLTKSIMDADRREAQLMDYRDRLTTLSKRADAKVEDLVKIESELSNVQSQLEALTAQKKGLDERVATEVLNVHLDAQRGAQSAFGPVTRALHRAGETLGESAGHALSFAIGSLPWLPIVGFAICLLIFTVKRLRRK